MRGDLRKNRGISLPMRFYEDHFNGPCVGFDDNRPRRTRESLLGYLQAASRSARVGSLFQAKETVA
jgi:hypothetical protein